jgi:hypothetical protein
MVPKEAAAAMARTVMKLRQREFAMCSLGLYRDAFAPPALSAKKTGFLAMEIAVGMTAEKTAAVCCFTTGISDVGR